MIQASVRGRSPSPPAMLLNETGKGLLVLWANRGTLVPELAVFTVFYVFLQFFIGGGRLVPALYASTLIGFCFYALTYVVTLKMVAGTLDEMNSGTLEQTHLSPLPSWLLSVGRLGAAAFEAVAVVLIVGALLVLTLGIHLLWSVHRLGSPWAGTAQCS